MYDGIPMGNILVIFSKVGLTVGSTLQNKSYGPNSSYRFAVQVGVYVKLTDDDGREYCRTCKMLKILDRDSTNWNDLLLKLLRKLR